MTPNHPTSGIAFVTGGGGGIGGATAERLAENGVAVAVADFNVDHATTVADRISAAGGTACALALDVTDSAAVIAAVAEAESVLGPIDQLVNTAGIFRWAEMEDISDEEFEQMFRVHVFGLHSMCRTVVPGMVARGAGGGSQCDVDPCYSGPNADRSLFRCQGRDPVLYEGAGA